MFSDFVLELIVQDLIVCLKMTIVAMVVMVVIAVPITLLAKPPADLPALIQRCFWIWLVGVANTAGSWILLTAFFVLGVQQLPQVEHILALPLGLIYLLCVVVSSRLMWRFANSSVSPAVKLTFSLRTLLLVQFILLALCGLWVACRRGEIERHYQLQAERTRQSIP